jgi:transcriptional regulator with XRE-family HTH domain
LPALGERFRAAREARGLSLSDVSEQVRIRSLYLAAIEEDNWKAIGAAVYVRGFLRTYARFLGLDPEEVVAAFNREVEPPGAASPAAPLPSRVERSSKPGSLLLWIAGIVAVLLVAFVAYNALTMRRPGPVAAQASAVPEATPAASLSPGVAGSAGPSATPSPPGGARSLALVLSEASWLRVVVDGSVSIEGTFPAGTSKTFHGKSALVRVGNAGGVEIFVDGKDVGKLGKPGDVAERSFTL